AGYNKIIADAPVQSIYFRRNDILWLCFGDSQCEVRLLRVTGYEKRYK
ncbi:MAG: hypothetical protein JWO03_1397, partial [Bacteroidetes bacterium]|nr:hypothetical protein [Bacteroidota bacterium]